MNKLRILIALISLLQLEVYATTNPLPKFKFLGAVDIPHESKAGEFQIGGLSSILYLPETDELLAVADDKGLLGGARIHRFKFFYTDGELTINSTGVIQLLDADNTVFYPDEIIDAEGLVRLPGNHLLVASEGIDVKDYFTPPGLYEFTSQGQLVKTWPIPDKFYPKQPDKPDFGIRANDAFEALSITPANNTLFMANEKALLQDGAVPSVTSASPIRVIRYNLAENHHEITAEYVYELSPLLNPDNHPEVAGHKSVSDFLALNDDQLLVIEKTFFTKPDKKNSVQVFLAEITPDTTNVIDMDSLKGQAYQAMKKTLWLDMDGFVGSENFPKIDNVEGISFGPVLENGHQTFLLISDNNFNPKQKNLFYLFEKLD